MSKYTCKLLHLKGDIASKGHYIHKFRLATGSELHVNGMETCQKVLPPPPPPPQKKVVLLDF